MTFETVFKLRVVFKSGYTMDFEVTRYEVSPHKMTWVAADKNSLPLRLDYDEVAAVWKIGERQRLSFS